MNDLLAWYAYLDTLDPERRGLAMASMLGALSVSAGPVAWQSALRITRDYIERVGDA